MPHPLLVQESLCLAQLIVPCDEHLHKLELVAVLVRLRISFSIG